MTNTQQSYVVMISSALGSLVGTTANAYLGISGFVSAGIAAIAAAVLFTIGRVALRSRSS